jgi:hypothetical protein
MKVSNPQMLSGGGPLWAPVTGSVPRVFLRLIISMAD